MRKQANNQMGNTDVISALVPMGAMNFLLGFFICPIETYLRRDFGERYYTRSNFVSGLIALVVWYMIGSLTSAILGSIPLITFFMPKDPTANTPSLMGSIIKWYLILGAVHFLTIKWREITGRQLHSYSSGRSWLRPIGRAIMFVLNLFLGLIVRIVVRFIPGDPKKRLSEMLPVLRDVDTFTERFIEPFAVFLWAMYATGSGQNSMFLWLLFSLMALNTYTGMRHAAQRDYLLDLRDNFIESRQMRDAMNGVKSKDVGANNIERLVRETAKEVEKTPEAMETVKRQHPALADAIAAMNAKLGKHTENAPAHSFNTHVNESIA